MIKFEVFPQGEYWVAECKEFDIVTQTRNLRDIGLVIERAVFDAIVVAKEVGDKRFYNGELRRIFAEHFQVKERGKPCPTKKR